MRLLRLMIVGAAMALSLSSCTLGRSGGGTQAKEGFTQCTPDPRIVCEPGSEQLAQSLHAVLPDALAEVERTQLRPFAAPVLIYTYASVNSFIAHSGAAAYAQGALAQAAVNISPTLLDTAGRTRGLLVHELSHLHLYQQLGALAWGRLPSWFHEGLATSVAAGGGAETFSEVDALYSMASGQCFVPEESAWILFPKKGASYGLNPHMFYRQAGMFVSYLREADPHAFARLLAAVEARQDFAHAFKGAYGVAVQPQWQQFLARSQGAFTQASWRKVDAMCARRSL